MMGLIKMDYVLSAEAYVFAQDVPEMIWLSDLKAYICY
jgi:hypothetical protein